jgi:HK97 family phage prohead protease
MNEPFYRGVDGTPHVERTADGLTIEGYLTRFDEVIRVWDPWNGEYFERIDPKAFNKTLKERSPIMLFNHGMDVTGNVPIGVWTSLRADDKGLYGVGRLFDNDLVKPVRDAIEGGGLRGQSIKFYPVPQGDKRSEDYQDGLPLIVRKEVRLEEGGPVTIPAYETTTVGVRSKPTQFSATSPAQSGHAAGLSPEPSEPTEATTSRASTDADLASVPTLDPELREALRRNLLEEISE